MVLVYTLKPFGSLTWVPCFAFLMCGTIRLARFNVITNRRVDRIGEERGFCEMLAQQIHKIVGH